MSNLENIIFFDTTLRDGEQSPGATMSKEEKVEIAKRLDKMGTHVIEAGFPAASNGDFESVYAVASEVKNASVAALCRADKVDIDRAWAAISHAVNPRIHTFIATSDIHLEYKLQIDRDECIEQVINAVSHAKHYTDNVEFSAEDGSRSDWDFLCKVFEVAIDAGATTVNLPDTVGYSEPDEFKELVQYVIENTKNIDKAILSVHCHNDLGMATANTLAGVKGGARQVEVTINGIGERAGNTSYEEVAMALKTRQTRYPVGTSIDTTMLYPVSRFVSDVTGMVVQSNKAIVGANAFAHEAGIHADGVLKNRMTYEIMKPGDVGVYTDGIIVGKHMGRSNVKEALKVMGYSPDNDEVYTVFKAAKKHADTVKDITYEDIEAIYRTKVMADQNMYSVEVINFSRNKDRSYSAEVLVYQNGNSFKGEVGLDIDYEESRRMDGPVDAIITATKKALMQDDKLIGLIDEVPSIKSFAVSATGGSSAALGKANLIVQNGYEVKANDASSDIIEAAAKAYVNGVNSIYWRHQNGGKKE